MARVLLVEDEKILAKNICFFLEKEGFEVDIVHDGTQSWEQFQKQYYDLVLLDWTLPGMDGLDVCRKIRQQSSVPIMMITAKEELVDKVVGLEVGADDYLTKPFHQRELLARMKALLRRSQFQQHHHESENIKTWKGLVLDKDRLYLNYKDQSVQLTALEFKLLDLFMEHPHNVFPREALFESVWGISEGYSDRTVDVNVSRLRKKIYDLSGLKVLHAIRGIGYKLGDQE